MSRNLDLISIGDINVDLLGEVERFPQADQEVEVLDAGRFAGGDAANVAVAAARLGLQVGYVGCVGDDESGEWLLEGLRQEGVDVSQVQMQPGAVSGFVFGAVRGDGQRILFAYKGANRYLSAQRIDPDYLISARAVHMSDPSLPVARACLPLAETAGCLISVDPGSITATRGMAGLEGLWPFIEVLFLNRSELSLLTGMDEVEEGAHRVLAKGPRLIAVKMGAQGCVLCSTSGTKVVAGFAVVSVDATGAGDAFDAACLAGLLKGWELISIGRFANAVGALATTAKGARSALPRYEEVLEFMSPSPGGGGKG